MPDRETLIVTALMAIPMIAFFAMILWGVSKGAAHSKQQGRSIATMCLSENSLSDCTRTCAELTAQTQTACVKTLEEAFQP